MSGEAFEPLACVLVESRPHEGPLQPAPLRDQTSCGFGFDPGSGASVAMSVAEAPGITLEGAASWSAKLLVTVREATACLVWSAALVATTTTPAACGKTCGAV